MRPTTEGVTADQGPRVTLDALVEKKRDGMPIVMVTAYDYPSSQAIEESGAVDLVLAGGHWGGDDAWLPRDVRGVAGGDVGHDLRGATRVADAVAGR